MKIYKYAFMDIDGDEDNREFDSFSEARENVLEGEAVIIRTYEYCGEHEVMWTPNGSEIWPPFLEG